MDELFALASRLELFQRLEAIMTTRRQLLIFVTLLLVVLWGLAAHNAEQAVARDSAVPTMPHYRPDTQGKILVGKLPARGVDSRMDKFRCGEHFLHDMKLDWGPKETQISFFQTPFHPEQKVSIAYLSAVRMVRTYITDAKQPEVLIMMHGLKRVGEVLFERDGLVVFPHPNDVREVNIYINRADYEKAATCLPKP